MNSSAAGSGRTSDDDLFVLCVVGSLSLGAAGAAAVAWWAQAVSWLLEHQVLVAADERPLLTVPGGAGAGLDLPRLALLAAALLVTVSAAVGAVRRRLHQQRLQ